ncbi:MAG: RES family NAD+ phosphorylase [Coriobacteriia bacterium]|nr:RES family NAD+ phosphorylase [Coriobacteriia bacterium]
MSAADQWADQRRTPPGGITGEPTVRTLPAGERLWRIHLARYEAGEFSVRVPTPPSGGRFDCADGSYGFLYAAESFAGAVAEAVLRDTPLVDVGERVVARATLRGRMVSVLELTRSVRLVSLAGADAAAVGQGLWLTKCGPADYPLTRAWARALHDLPARPDGLTWRARFDENTHVQVLFGDRCADALRVVASLPVDSGEGLEATRRVLLDHRAVVEG